MVKTREELLSSIRASLGDNTDDASLALIEDVSDTLEDYENRVNNDGTDWKAEAERIDKEWRQKYRDRFFNPEKKPDEDPLDPEPIEPKQLTFEALFDDGSTK